MVFGYLVMGLLFVIVRFFYHILPQKSSRKNLIHALERSPMEVWGNILLNGTDVLTITAVFGYLMQKFIVTQ